VSEGGSKLKAGAFNAARNGAIPRVIYVKIFTSHLTASL